MDLARLVPATPVDRQIIWPLWHACAQDPQTRWNSAYPTEAILDADLESGCLYALRYRHMVTGSVPIQPADPLQGLGYPFAPCVHPASLTRLCIQPALWRQGLGSDLLSLSEQQAMAAGADALHLLCDAENTAGLALFLRAGYVRVCRTVRSGDVLTVLEKSLTP